MRSNRYSKGSGIQMVFFAIMISSLVAGITAYVQAERLPPAFAQTVELESVTKPEHRLDDTVRHFIPMAGTYAVADGAYNVSTYNRLFKGEPNDDTDEVDVYEEIVDRATTQSQTYYEDYLDPQQYRNCRVEISPTSQINISYSKSTANVSSKNGNTLVDVECRTQDTELKASTSKNKQVEFNTSNLRFQELSSIVTKTLVEMEAVSEQLEANNRVSGVKTGTACGSKSAAIAEANRAIDDQFSDIEKSIVSEENGFSIVPRFRNSPLNGRGAEYRLDKATRNDNLCFAGFCVFNPHRMYEYEAKIIDSDKYRENDDPQDIGNCGSPRNPIPLYEENKGFEYRSITVQINITDKKFTIPTEHGFKKLYMNKKYKRQFDVS